MNPVNQGSDIYGSDRVYIMLHADITKRIIAAAMKVHATLGNGFQEVIYQRALAIEMPLFNLAFEREKEMRSIIGASRSVPAGLTSLLMARSWLN